jgi:ParB family chromosome partitioning protein
MQIITIALSEIDVGKRLRPIDPDQAAMIAASMAERGLDEPVKVRVHPRKNASYGYCLVAGGHRFRGAELNGWDGIAAIVVEASDLQAEMMELEENLVRHELNALDRAVFLAKWQTVYRALHPEAQRGGDRKSAAKNQTAKLAVRSGSFSDAARERIGLSERSVYRAVKLADALPFDVRAGLAGSDIARNASDLELLAKQSLETMREVVKQLKARSGKGAAADLIRAASGVAATGTEEDREKWFKLLMRGWKNASKRERDAFLVGAGLAEIGQEIAA